MLDIDFEALCKGQRRALAKAITLIESTNPAHRREAAALLERCLPHSGNSLRIGISGVPGVGKSTFIEAFGLFLIGLGKRVGVLAVDPSSPLHGGSILGDKTRMEHLSREDNAFIRPSPAGRSLGGVANRTREAILVAESAGFDVILVETVGVGQSEYEVHSMTDLFLVLMQPGAGDELQGIKKGILELADFIVVNKADGDAERLASQSVMHYKNAMGFLNHQGFWTPEVLSVSSLEPRRIDSLWARMEAYCEAGLEAIPERRSKQSDQWFERLLNDSITDLLKANATWAALYHEQKARVASGEVTPPHAALACIGPLGKALSS
ncbi:MAG: methylmalonyl Co-A mutase-associated GTPase MeaB [Pseudomonadota bacterium]|nr:methylmalonyl Co-A mutase-associated GTPase MeaB [Pseudomonadota bacterium]MEE2820915.1 methylmalonyl Co-A mutase-associated GTPase MeaB [Pseudomonadota bacterium]